MQSLFNVIASIQEYIEEYTLEEDGSDKIFTYNIYVKGNYLYVIVKYNSSIDSDFEVTSSADMVLLKERIDVVLDYYNNDNFNQFLSEHLELQLPKLKTKQINLVTSPVIFQICGDLEYTLNEYESKVYLSNLITKHYTSGSPIKAMYYTGTATLNYNSSNLCQEIVLS